ncbi:fucose-specific lectin [Sphaerosporella brunnea]|uniref:Fucose-specific lectin n=1 Tax=Sphaerosporella brunnea TaxID=1250544 RepID=A0A5J5EHI2_9PEZI|nr:fucose-specific lectin [Sphaerosporella brunnea]
MTFNPKTSMLRHSAIAACAFWPTDRQHIFFQDHDGGIRQITHKNGFVGGDKHSRLAIANNAKWHTPLAAAGYEVPCSQKDCSGNNRAARIHLFYLNAENFIRSVTFNGEFWVTATDFNKQLIRVHPSSKLSVIAMYPSNVLRLYYQTEDKKLNEHIYTAEAGWLHQATLGAAITGSAIAATAYPCRDEISVFFQDASCTLRQIHKVDKDVWREGSLNIPGAPPQCAFSAVSHTGLIWNMDIIRLHVVTGRKTVSEWVWYHSNNAFSEATDLSSSTLPHGNIAAIVYPKDEKEEVRFYFQGDHNEMLAIGLVAGTWEVLPMLSTGETSLYETR